MIGKQKPISISLPVPTMEGGSVAIKLRLAGILTRSDLMAAHRRLRLEEHEHGISINVHAIARRWVGKKVAGE